MPPCIEHDVPVARRFRILFYKFGQQVLCEVGAIFPTTSAGDLEDEWPRRVHDLSGIRRQRAVSTGHHVRLLHNLVGSVLDALLAALATPHTFKIGISDTVL